ncbi:hypothetical protein EI77_00369 [Prosthecobacter fusiformis]|uniref:Uncharacterized protein n=1 Tax=Prosthecobacter fusiformis TaxID=48464 RepID=A0A4R7SS97_9BACT|nr:hypothetical protein [Prosthecobacter fusiformis]TDU81067.1 hypothetical protein EI77_00369 [Prosthecobacter fusiformis]
MKTAIIFWLILVAGVVAADLDLANLKDRQKEGKPVIPERLTALIGDANRVVVIEEGPSGEERKLYESRERKDLDALSSALVVIKPDEWFHCMCLGSPTINLYKDEELIGQISNHHGQSVRCSLWSSDAVIADVENWLKWFDDRKLDGPRKEVEENRARQDQHERDWRKWVAAIPKGLEPVWEDSFSQFLVVDTKPLINALKVSIPKKEDQILALLKWFGCGAGPWSGFPSYESVAEELLLTYQVDEIVSAIEVRKLIPEQVEGAARLFGGWDFSRKHPKGLAEVPDVIKRTLWDQVKDTNDKDKLERARRAFKP